MNRHIPSFREFINESKLPHELEMYNLYKLSWNEDESAIEKLKDKNKKAEFAKAFVATDKDRDLKYLLLSWFSNGNYFLQLLEDNILIFNEDYDETERRYYDQDCETILGTKIKH